MRLIDVKNLHNTMNSEYENWVRSAPDDWKSDGFLENHVPLSISVRYGQNLPIANNHNIAIERQAWQEDRDFSKIRFVSLALATDIMCRKVEGWNPRPLGDILRGSPEIFDHYDPDSRREIDDLEAHEIVDEAGAEINIYDASGFRIPRRLPIGYPAAKPCSILFNLRNIGELFVNLDDTLEDEDEEEQTFDEETGLFTAAKEKRPELTPHWAYPQAFLRSYGHFKAKGLLNMFYPLLNNLNTSLRGENSDMEEDDDEDDQVEFALRKRNNYSIVTGVSSQGYNELSHRVRSSAKLHDVQLGQITATFAGPNASNPRGKAKSRAHLRNLLDGDLPHTRFNDKIATPNQNTAFRLENVYTINIMGLERGQRTGS
jgi:hypothetical protein